MPSKERTCSSVTVVPPSNKTCNRVPLLCLLVMMNVIKCHHYASFTMRHYSYTLVHLPSLEGTKATLKYVNHNMDALQGHLGTYSIIRRH